MKRRHFLQFAGSTLATLGISQLELQQKGLQYARVLAQGTPRKLALLVGIDNYVDEKLRLYGCVTDVNLQKELLIHRYGFKENDILTVTDRQATREGIITAFQEHLVKQAKPGDVVVFHYSGHGSEVLDLDKDDTSGKNSTFVPVESTIPAESGGTVIDITGHSLFLLMKAVNTENMTVILDSCHSGGGTRGNLRIRARNSGGKEFLMSPMEKKLQEQMLAQLNLSPQDYIKLRKEGIARGIAIASTQRNQLAADAPFGDFAAGAFTYALTQYLWQMTDDQVVKTILPNVGRTTTNLSSQGQVPLYEIAVGGKGDDKPMYFLNSTQPPAEGVIQKVNGQQADIWLGGIDPKSIEAFQSGAVFSIVDGKSQEIGEMQLESREGLRGKGKLIKGSGQVKEGTIVQEKVRSLPKDFSLKIGLALSLGNDAKTAEQALKKLPRTVGVPILKGSVHYILGRMTEKIYREQTAKSGEPVPVVGSIGLFSQAEDPLSGSFGAKEESIDAAIDRLKPKLKSLLAAQIIKLTLNTDSSKLNVTVSMNPEGQDTKLLGKVFPTRGMSPGTATNTEQIIEASRLPVGTAVQFQVANSESVDLFLSILVIDPTGKIDVAFPNNYAISDDAMRVTAGEMIRVPDPNKGDQFQLKTSGPKGMNEVLIIASKVSLKNALKVLQQDASKQGTARGPIGLDDPVSVMDSLLSDIDEGNRSRSRGGTRGLPAVARGVNTSQLATMSISFEVI